MKCRIGGESAKTNASGCLQQGVVDALLNQDRTHNTTNEITAIAKTVGDVWPTPAYEANGNMTEFPQPDDLESSFDATWDAWNRLVELADGSETVAEYGYDGLNRRIIKCYRPNCGRIFDRIVTVEILGSFAGVDRIIVNSGELSGALTRFRGADRIVVVFSTH